MKGEWEQLGGVKGERGHRKRVKGEWEQGKRRISERGIRNTKKAIGASEREN